MRLSHKHRERLEKLTDAGDAEAQDALHRLNRRYNIAASGQSPTTSDVSDAPPPPRDNPKGVRVMNREDAVSTVAVLIPWLLIGPFLAWVCIPPVQNGTAEWYHWVGAILSGLTLLEGILLAPIIVGGLCLFVLDAFRRALTSSLRRV